MVIPRLVGQALSGSPLTVYSTGSQTRCFCHVADVVEALLGLIGNTAAEGQVFNVGSQEEVSILELAERVISVTGSASKVELVPYDVAYQTGFEDMQRRRPDTTRIRNLLGWMPTRTLNDIVVDVAADLKSRS
jgi:UDP-glucose 4-epimerase